ncbi:hypothetical protein SAMN05443667_101114 [Flavobacterium gillisiae]|uniref:Uncharacterized protein n=1 Tax=Flavobacterium gillisiae TaxID=150146 RepID=A0A1H3WKU7_9FLAO|nr:hypothetical protein SAMN05443667_101114 [Flavobacterium gillisiae]
MSDYIFLIVLIILLILYLFFFKVKLMKWEERDSVEKSYSNRLTAILVAGILLWIYKIMKS